MKKVLFVAAFASIGLVSAFASTRATFNYGQSADGTYRLLSQPIDLAKCTAPKADPCTYVSPSNVGSTAVAKSTLIGVGATPSAATNQYLGL